MNSTVSTLLPAPRLLSLGFLQRLLILAVLFAVEAVLLSVWLDNGALAQRGGIMGFVGQWGAWVVRGIVGFAAIFVTFAYLKSRPALAALSEKAERLPVSRGLLAAHFVAMGGFAALSWAIYGGADYAWGGLLWLLAGAGGIAFGSFALAPWRLWLQLVRETGALWIYALAAVIAACVAGAFSRTLWAPAAELTFILAKAMLSPFVSAVVADPAARMLGTAKFSVEIAPECSGFEGAGLMLAFGTIWLTLFRRECRFPQALALIPVSIVIIFLMNAARIAALILIGNAGAEKIALGGFHSQAGWISFNIVALGFSIAARRLPWLMTSEAKPRSAAVSEENPTAAYLLPFLSILAVGIVTAAASGDFEWLYPIRFLAAAGCLWILRKRYGGLDWRFGWFGITMGVAVFAIWIALDSFQGADRMPAALASAQTPLRATWIAMRALSAIVTVPIAEELAFRGFLLRRLVAADFEAVPATAFHWFGLAISSVAFGALHGQHWLAGVLAGVLFAWAVLRRGRIGEAVVAHAVANAMLAGYVLYFQQWHLW